MTEAKFIASDIPRPGKIRLEITREAIDAAIRADSSACVIADAIKAQFPGANPDVDLQTITFTMRDKGYRYTWLTPASGQDHLIRFDQGYDVPPFVLMLDTRELVKARKKAPPQPKTGGRTLEAVDQERGRVKVTAVRGARVPVDVRTKPMPAAVLSNRKGRVRRYGMKQAKPGVAGPA